MFGKKEDSIEELEEETQKAINWIAAEYKYLTKLNEDLRNIEESTDKNEQEKMYKKAWRALRYVSRSQRKAARELFDVEEGLKKLVNGHPELIKTEKDIEIFSNQLTKAFSLYAGKFKKKLATIILTIHKKEEINQDEFKELVKSVEEDVENLIELVRGLEVSLKEAKRVEEEIEKSPNDMLKDINANPEYKEYLEKGLEELGDIFTFATLDNEKKIKTVLNQGVGKSFQEKGIIYGNFYTFFIKTPGGDFFGLLEIKDFLDDLKQMPSKEEIKKQLKRRFLLKKDPDSAENQLMEAEEYFLTGEIIKKKYNQSREEFIQETEIWFKNKLSLQPIDRYIEYGKNVITKIDSISKEMIKIRGHLYRNTKEHFQL